MKIGLILTIAFFSLTCFAQDEIEVPQIGVSIPLGESATLKGVSITFIKILEDSRCPKSVDCIWAGRVRIQIAFQDDDSIGGIKELIFGETKGNESADKTIYRFADGLIEAKMVYPYPQKPGEKLEYKLLVDWKSQD